MESFGSFCENFAIPGVHCEFILSPVKLIGGVPRLQDQSKQLGDQSLGFHQQKGDHGDHREPWGNLHWGLGVPPKRGFLLKNPTKLRMVEGYPYVRKPP